VPPTSGTLYRVVFDLLLARLDPETAHRVGAVGLRLLGAVPGMRRALAPRDPVLRIHALGLDLPTPLGVAAGFDKDARLVRPLGALGFGFVEVGTVTARPQQGNPRPRVFRYADRRALVNRMGFPNEGAAAAAERLRRRPASPAVGVNVGKSRAVAIEDAPADYAASVRALVPFADYLVLNVSSPNTPGLRALQAVDALEAIVLAVQAELASLPSSVPLLVKIAPDLGDDELDSIADAAVRLGLAGLIAVNTTLVTDADEPWREAGGLSGAPLRERALAVLERLAARTNGKLVLVSVGGIESAEDVVARLRAGATLVQAYTSFVYGGPLWARRVNRELARLVRAAGLSSVTDL